MILWQFLHTILHIIFSFTNLDLYSLSILLWSDERDGLGTSLDQCQQMVKESRLRETELQGQVAALESQVQALNTAKQQVIILLKR